MLEHTQEEYTFILPDQRLAKRGVSILNFIITHSRVVMQKIDSWKDQISYYRFLSNDRVKEEDLITSVHNHCSEHCCSEKHLLLIEDTTELNMEAHSNRVSDDASVVGIIDLHLWHREQDKQDKDERNYKHLPFEEKESYRWAERAVISRERLKDVETVTVVQDREGDIYESFCHLRRSGVDWIIRSAQNRLTTKGKLFEIIEHFPVSGHCTTVINSDNKKRVSREATLEVRYGTVELCRPCTVTEKSNYPATLSVQVVYVKETPDSVPPDETPIEWILFTSHAVGAIQIVACADNCNHADMRKFELHPHPWKIFCLVNFFYTASVVN